ncbi:MAG: NAD(P)/FAD-dependent oxidoreductase [Firmicutes bacterium]|nr:NAD(P)/FAD-dependent oxidoreductase [Bacillota bacterium]
MKSSYDVVVIGSGLGGLTAAATLAKEGLSVLVLEQYCRFGGFGQSYSIDGYIFDTAVHAIWYWEEIAEMLQELGIKLEVVPARRADRILFKNGIEYYATSIPEMKEQIQRLAPNDAVNIARYYDTLIESQKALINFTYAPNNLNAQKEFLKYRNLWKMTLEEVVSNVSQNPLTQDLLYGYHDGYLYDYSWYYPAFHLFNTKYLYDGFSPIGGSQSLVDALVLAIKESGGELQANTLVKKIIVENNSVKGVITSNGDFINAKKAVISNADVILTLEKLIGREFLPSEMIRSLDKCYQNVPSLSYYILNVGLDIDVKKVYGLKGDLTIYYPSHNILEGFKKINSGSLPDDFWVWMVFPSVNDATVAPKGHSVAIYSILVPYHCEQNSHVDANYKFDGFSSIGEKGKSYYDFKENLTQKILNKVEEVYPGISAHITVKDLVTPQTIERITLNYKGSTLGVKVVPDFERTGSYFSMGFKVETIINKLFLVGAWAERGFSAPAAMGTGRVAASKIIGKELLSIRVDSKHRMQHLHNLHK